MKQELVEEFDIFRVGTSVVLHNQMCSVAV